MSDPSTPPEKITKQTAGIADTVSDVLTEVRPLLNRIADQVTDSVHELAKQGKDAACAAEDSLEENARHVRVTAEHYIQHAPFKSILIAAGTGAATALAVSWFMRSRTR